MENRDTKPPKFVPGIGLILLLAVYMFGIWIESPHLVWGGITGYYLGLTIVFVAMRGRLLRNPDAILREDRIRSYTRHAVWAGAFFITTLALFLYVQASRMDVMLMGRVFMEFVFVVCVGFWLYNMPEDTLSKAMRVEGVRRFANHQGHTLHPLGSDQPIAAHFVDALRSADTNDILNAVCGTWHDHAFLIADETTAGGGWFRRGQWSGTLCMFEVDGLHLPAMTIQTQRRSLPFLSSPTGDGTVSIEAGSQFESEFRVWGQNATAVRSCCGSGVQDWFLERRNHVIWFCGCGSLLQFRISPELNPEGYNAFLEEAETLASLFRVTAEPRS